MQERGLVGLEARTADGEEAGRISEVITDEESGEVTHVMVETEEGDQIELPITAVVLDPEADFATFHADRSDEEPGDHVADAEQHAGYAPLESDEEDSLHERQFVTEPESIEEAQSEEDLAREDWEDESYTADSGYPRNDAYVDPETGDETVDPLLKDNESLQDDVADLLDGTGLRVRSEKDGVVELTGSSPTQEDLEAILAELMGLNGVLEVDTTDVEIN